MRPAKGRAKGFTLLEIVIVLAIIAVIAGLAVAAYTNVGTASAPRNALNDFSAGLVRARSMAIENQSNVWLIVYPDFNKQTMSNAGGKGAWFIYEDRNGTFGLASGAPTSTDVYWLSSAGGVAFDPAADTIRGSTETEGALRDAVYLDDYAGNNVEFGLPTGGITMTAAHAPFASLSVTTDCTFCSGTPARGAIVFSPDGSARFINDAGAVVASAGATSVSRARAVVLKDKQTPATRTWVVAVSGPTSFVGTYELR